MKIHRYPARSLAGDYLRAAIGVGIGLGVLLSVPTSTAIVIVFGGLLGVFGLFAIRTAQRQLLQVALTDEALSQRGLVTRVLDWRELTRFKLRFYGSRRQPDKGAGFMQLKLAGAGTSFSFESNLEGFEQIVQRAARAARDNGIALDTTSLRNLQALGFETDGLLAPQDSSSPP